MKIFRDAGLLCGEGPLWQKENDRLIWVDSDLTFVYAGRLDCAETKVLSADIQVSSVALSKDGYILLGDGLWKMGEDGEKTLLKKEFEGEELFFNDSVVGPDGSIYAGTYYWNSRGMRKYGKLYRIAQNADIQVLDDGIALSNGLAFSPDHTLLYYSDSARRCIYQYDLRPDGAGIMNKRIFIRSKEGIPDGITVDSEGYVWCAMWYEGRVYRFDPDGKKERVYELPAKQVSSVAFGGSDMSVLFVTSAASLFKSDLIPASFDENAHMGGEIYCKNTEIAGIPECVADL